VRRCNFQDDERVSDHLGLSQRLNQELRTASSAARGAKLVYLDVEDFPDAIELAGRYRVDGKTVKATVTLFRGDHEIGRFVADGSRDDLAELARQIVQKAQALLPAPPE
jgi:hypothetical protein